MQEEPRGVTRWRRSALIAVPATCAIAAMTLAMVQGVLAANLSLTSVPFTLSSNTVAAPKGLGAVMTTVTAGSPTAAAEVGLPKAGLDGICIHAVQSVNLPVVGTVGTWSLNISSPAAATPLTSAQLASGQGIQANNLILDAQSVKGATATLNATATTPNQIGAAADSANIKGTGITDGTAGQFGLDATGGQTDISGLKANANGATIGGAITLPDLAINLANGDTAGKGAGGGDC
ncbi:cholesterol esterase [Kitasatospora sp. NPDC096147]|uniref:cholesterol esterase n=1 Tax=Kitasatospora sp. NPDC096147 TaxID=3364093 RepID=UPI0037F63DD8